MPISCVSLESPSIRLRKYVVKGRGATHLHILALRAAHWDAFLYIAAAVRWDAGRENVSPVERLVDVFNTGDSSGAELCARILKSLVKAAWCLWRVSTVFTRSAITPPEVKRFGWKLWNTRSILLIAAGPGKGRIAVTCRITLNHLSTAAMRLMSN